MALLLIFAAVGAAAVTGQSQCEGNLTIADFVVSPGGRNSKAPAGPRPVLIDLGANCGNSFHSILRDYPRLDRPTLQAFLWEPDPRLVSRWLRPISKKDPRVFVVNGAASVDPGVSCASFYLDARTDSLSTAQLGRKRCNRWGIATSSSLHVRADSRKGRPIHIASVDVLQWLLHLELRREDEVFVKIDIEGHELRLVPHLMSAPQELWCLVDTWAIEWHARLWPARDDVERTRNKDLAHALGNATRARAAVCGGEVINDWP